MARRRRGRFEVFPSGDGYRWRLKAGNGEIVAQSEGYTLEADARRGAKTAKKVAKRAKVYGLLP